MNYLCYGTTLSPARPGEYGFQENQDYVRFSPKSGKIPQGGRPTIDYHLTFDMAKGLGMVERHPIGRAIRLYFIHVNLYSLSLVDLLAAPTQPHPDEAA